MGFCQVIYMIDRLIVQDFSEGVAKLIIPVTKNTFVSIFGKNLDSLLAKQLIDAYIEIWREDPWNENWKSEDVQVLLKNLQEKRDFVLLLQLGTVDCDMQSQIASFTWAYDVDQDDLLKIAGFDPGAIYGDTNNSFIVALDSVFSNNSRVAYLAELGTKEEFRHNHNAWNLSIGLLYILQKRGYNKVVLRTDVRALGAKKLYRKLGFVDLGVKDAVHQNRTYWMMEI